MATEFQIQFVKNIEKTMRALAVKDRTAPSISAIMEDAGYDAVGLFAIVNRLKEAGENELLSRLRSVFEYARKMPKCLMDVKPSLEPFVISPPLDKGEVASEAQRAISGFDRGMEDDEASVLAEVISMLRPLKHVGRTRILGATSMFYGVGE